MGEGRVMPSAFSQALRLGLAPSPLRDAIAGPTMRSDENVQRRSDREVLAIELDPYERQSPFDPDIRCFENKQRPTHLAPPGMATIPPALLGKQSSSSGNDAQKWASV